MPAGGGKHCELCTWEKSFSRRAAILVESFGHAFTRQRFADFCQWLKVGMGAHEAALKLENYLSFFSFLDAQSPGTPSYVSLLNHFSADGLRRMQKPMLWLKLRYGVEPDAAVREEHSEKRRIVQMLKSVPAGIAADVLNGYWAYLMTKQSEGNTTLPSVRLSLRAAINVLAATSPVFDALPTQKSVTVYLTHTPGQAAALQGFIGYLNRNHGCDLSTAVSDLAKARAHTRKLEAELLALYRSGGEGEAFERTWIKAALMLLHGLPRVNKKMIVYSTQSFESQPGFSVKLNAKEYWVPSHAELPAFAKTSPE